MLRLQEENNPMKHITFYFLLGFQIIQAQELTPLPIPVLKEIQRPYYGRGGRGAEVAYFIEPMYPVRLYLTILDRTDNQPFVFVQIKFVDLKTKEERLYYTDEYGNITLDNIQRGRYSVELFPNIGRGTKRFRYKKIVSSTAHPFGGERYTFKL